MASRFWVGGTGNWDAATTTNWSATSGGAGGQSVPTSADTVTFDANSGGGTVTGTATMNCSSFTAGAFTGTFNTNGQTFNTGAFSITGAGTRSITLGASTLNITSWAASTTTNLTFSAASSTIVMTGGGNSFAGGGLTYGTVNIGNTSITMTGANTFSNLSYIPTTPGKFNQFVLGGNITITTLFTVSNGATATNRIFIYSSTVGTARTITSASNAIQTSDFMDITGAGAASWNLSAITGLSGDCGGNSGITFTTGANQYYKIGASANWSTTANWFLATNGGGGAGRVPLPQDTAIFDANSITAGSVTITQDMPRIGGVNWTGVTNSPTWTTSTSASVFGSVTLVSGMTLTASTQFYTFRGRSSFTLTNAGKSWAKQLVLEAPGGTLTLQDNLTNTTTSNAALGVNFGTFDANDFNVVIDSFQSSGTGTRVIVMGNGTWELNGTAASSVLWNCFTTTNLTITPEGSTIKITGSTVNSRQFTGGTGLIYNNIWISNATSGGTFRFNSGNTFNDFKCDTPPNTIQFTAGTTTTVTTFTVNGTAGNLITIDSVTTGTHTLTAPSRNNASPISCDYLNIQHSVATQENTWYAGVNSTNNQAVATAGSGWIFTAPPAPGGNTRKTLSLLGVG